MPGIQLKELVPYAGSGERILLVEDEAIQRSIAFDILERMGYYVKVVSSGEAVSQLPLLNQRVGYPFKAGSAWHFGKAQSLQLLFPPYSHW